ncbi:discoidin domain-containing protein [Agromyces humatus]|uniref:exo-alpha-sialidase n=1 Tax=Agromyces humatus TaxID=279573 RepID=A0ABP4X3G8_9MICO|nr:discoidin domain-containing protein [Agromyces humatus]
MSFIRSPQRRVGAASLVVAVGLVGAVPMAAHADTAPAPDFDAKPPQAGEPFYAEQQLATNGVGFPNYRIPALAVTNDGDILASYDGRPTAADSPGPNSILQRRSTDNGATWEEQTFIHEGKVAAPIEGYSDPSYIVDRHTGDIFNFHVKSFDRGFGNSQPGVDPEARNVIHAEVSVSEDDGHTWEHEVVTADVTADLDWRSRFAASGQGIQLKYGEHAGRLIQQFTIINNDLGGAFQAVSVYSDDHGETWQVGEPVGVGMDENKTVELSDGRVMLNSRDSQRSGFRKVAISDDGGVTYGEVVVDQELPDPTNNAAILRAFPNAEEGSDRAKVLLFSNAGSSTQRANGVVRMSFDDGETWPVAKVFQPGGMAYSTLATLPNGNIGLLYEPESGNGGIRFAEFNLAWLEGLAAPMEIADVAAGSGTTVEVPVTITNQSGRAHPKAELTLDLPEGWVLEGVTLPELRPGVMVAALARITVPAGTTAGTYDVTARLTSLGNVTEESFTVTVDLLDKSAMTATASSENPSSGEGAAQAIDGNLRTHWHSAWSTQPQPTHPHDLTVDLGGVHEVRALHYTPRQNGTNGRIGSYEVYGSTDGETWGEPLASGRFAAGTVPQRVAFDATEIRYVRLVAFDALDGSRFASVAELDVEGVR